VHVFIINKPYACITANQLAQVEQEWDEYVALSAGVAAKQDVLQFFKVHQGALPTMAAVVCDLALIPPSSAACERVFSLSTPEHVRRPPIRLSARLHRHICNAPLQQKEHIKKG